MREKYARRLRRENLCIAALLLLSVVWMIMIGEGWFFGLTVLDSRAQSEAAQRFDAWFFIAQAALIIRHYHNRRLLRDALKLEESRIRAQDERNAAIHRTAGGYFAPVMLAGLFLATLMTSFLEMTVFHTLSWVLTAGIVLYAGLQIWLRQRM